MRNHTNHDTKAAFTLVELLVVITIIGILSSLITVAVGGARRAAKRAAIAMELSQISDALEDYKNKFGEYPPDLYEPADVVRHVKKRWPRFELYGSNNNEKYFAFITAVNNFYRGSNRIGLLSRFDYTGITATTNFMGDISTNPSSGNLGSLDTTRYSRYIGALPLWLGGFPNEDGVFSGFSADPQAPFGRDEGTTPKINNGDYTHTWSYNDIRLGTQDKKGVSIHLEIGKNVNFVKTSGDIVFPCIVNTSAGNRPVPYVYFRSKSDGGPLAYAYEISRVTTPPLALNCGNKSYNFNAVFGTGTDMGQLGVIAPYVKKGNPLASSGATSPLWYEAGKFQLIHPGLDGVFASTTVTSGTYSYTEGATAIDLDFDMLRSTQTDVDDNAIGNADYDNITNFSNNSELKTLTE